MKHVNRQGLDLAQLEQDRRQHQMAVGALHKQVAAEIYVRLCETKGASIVEQVKMANGDQEILNAIKLDFSTEANVARIAAEQFLLGMGLAKPKQPVEQVAQN